MTYPYTGRNLFLQPKSYAYAVCDRDNYLNDWKVSRKGAKNALVKQASAEYEIDDSVRLIRQVLTKVDMSQTGKFLDRTGSLIPWNMEEDLNV